MVLGKLLEQDDYNLGYDAAKGEYVEMVKAGIIDSFKVIRTAIPCRQCFFAIDNN